MKNTQKQFKVFLDTSVLLSAHKIIDSEDTPILAGAIKAKADFLITLDKRFQKLAKGKVKLKILSPGEFLEIIRAK